MVWLLSCFSYFHLIAILRAAAPFRIGLGLTGGLGTLVQTPQQAEYGHRIRRQHRAQNIHAIFEDPRQMQSQHFTWTLAYLSRIAHASRAHASGSSLVAGRYWIRTVQECTVFVFPAENNGIGRDYGPARRPSCLKITL